MGRPTAEERRDERLLGGYSGRLLLFLSFGSLLSSSGRLLLSPMLPTIIESLEITASQAGLALSVMWALTALTQYPGGQLADDLSTKTVLVGGLSVLACGFAVLASASSYPLFLLGAIMTGVGAGLYTPSVYAELVELFVERRGQAFGIHTGSVNTGGVVAAILGTAILAAAAWQQMFVPLALSLVVLVGLVHLTSPKRYVVGLPHLAPRALLARFVGVPQLRWLLLVTALFAFVWQGTANFLPTYLRVEKGFSATLANGAFAGVFVVGMLTNPLAGGVGDRFGHLRTLVGVTVAATAGLTVLTFADDAATALLGVGLFAIGLTTFWPLVMAVVMDELPATNREGDFGAARTIWIGIGSFGPAYIGVVGDWKSYTTAFGSLAVVLLVCVAVAAALARGTVGESASGE